MAENKMEALAELLGVELEEEFRLSNRDNYKYKLTRNGIWCCCTEDNDYWESAGLPGIVFSGGAEIHKSILTKSEKEYLSAVIKPFRDRILYIKKRETNQDEYIRVFLSYYAGEGEDEVILLPAFKKGTMYKGMKNEEEYTLEELEL